MSKKQLSLISPVAETQPEEAEDVRLQIAQIAALPLRMPEEREPSEAAVDQGHGRIPSYTEIGLQRLPKARSTLKQATENKRKHWPPEEAA